MTLFYYGHCQKCDSGYVIEGRRPNFCPECGTKLTNEKGKYLQTINCMEVQPTILIRSYKLPIVNF